MLGDEDTVCNGPLLIRLVLPLFDQWYVDLIGLEPKSFPNSCCSNEAYTDSLFHSQEWIETFGDLKVERCHILHISCVLLHFSIFHIRCP